MNRRPICCIQNCSKESIRFVFKKPYCNDHFEPAAEKAFIQEYHKWDGISENARNMMDLFSIYAAHKYNRTRWPVYLSRARIRDRTYNIRKIKDGLTFCIRRHLNAWSDFKLTVNVEELYRYSIEDQKFELLCQDPDDKVNSCAWDIADALITKKTNPAIELKDSEKYGRIILINLKKNPPDVQYKTKRLKIKLQLLIKLYSNLEEINYGNRIAFKYKEN